MIKTENVTKEFDNGKKGILTAVIPTNLEIRKGEVYGILGPNGAGKTTLLRMLGAIMRPTSGKIFYNDEQIDEANIEFKRKMGFLSGNTKLYGRLSPRELLSYFGELYDLDKNTIKKRTEEIIDIMNLGEFIDKNIEKLSTGQVQRTSIARCIINNPELYILDEPTLGLDLMSGKAIIDFITGEKEKGKTIIFSTHYMEEAEILCDRIALMHKGKIFDTDTFENYKAKSGKNNLREVFFHYIEQEGEIDAN